MPKLIPEHSLCDDSIKKHLMLAWGLNTHMRFDIIPSIFTTNME